MKRILFLGFSVTADKAGFAVVLRDRLPAEEFQVEVCGLGGFHPIHLVHFVGAIIADRPSDIVVLDLNTPAWRRSHYGPADYHWQIRYTIEAIKRTGAAVLFANFPRVDVDYTDDLASREIERVCAETGCAYLDVAADLYQAGVVASLLKDEVHVTAEGTEIYADRVETAIRSLPDSQPKCEPVLPLGRFGYLSVGRGTPYETEEFERTGFSDRCIVINEGEQKDVFFQSPIFVGGALVVTGPRAGWIKIENDGGESRRFLAYDRNSYYRRFIPQQLTSFLASSLKITADPDLPDVDLLKGTSDVGPRQNCLAGFLVSDAPIVDTIREMKAALGELAT